MPFTISLCSFLSINSYPSRQILTPSGFASGTTITLPSISKFFKYFIISINKKAVIYSLAWILPWTRIVLSYLSPISKATISSPSWLLPAIKYLVFFFYSSILFFNNLYVLLIILLYLKYKKFDNFSFVVCYIVVNSKCSINLFFKHYAR